MNDLLIPHQDTSKIVVMLRSFVSVWCKSSFQDTSKILPRYFQDSSVVRICIGWNKQNVRSESDQKYIQICIYKFQISCDRDCLVATRKIRMFHVSPRHSFWHNFASQLSTCIATCLKSTCISQTIYCCAPLAACYLVVA